MGYLLVIGLVLLILGLSNGGDSKGSIAASLIGLAMLFIGVILLFTTGTL